MRWRFFSRRYAERTIKSVYQVGMMMVILMFACPLSFGQDNSKQQVVTNQEPDRSGSPEAPVYPHGFAWENRTAFIGVIAHCDHVIELLP
jgi:hypothetical protein